MLSSSKPLQISGKSHDNLLKMAEKTSKTITIDGKQYAVEQLSREARQQVSNLRVVDAQIARLRAELTVAQTARLVYARTLQASLGKAE